MELRVADADNHLYEVRDAFTRYIDPAFRDRTFQGVVGDDGVERLVIEGEDFPYHPNQFELIPRPGGLRDVMRSISAGELGNYYDEDARVPVWPAFVDRDARVALLDEQGVECTLLFGSTQPCVELYFEHDVDLNYASWRAYNHWLMDDWGFAYKDRIFAAPTVSLLDPERAVVELDWLLDRDVRIVYLRPGPQGHRSPADPVFDPFWARIQEARVLVGCHSSESGYNDKFSVYWGELPRVSSHYQSAFQWVNFFGDRPIMDTLSAFVLHNLFGRFPDLRILTVENGSLWVPYLLKVMDKMKGMGRGGPWLGGKVDGRPSEIFREHVWVVPFHEEPIQPLLDAMGVDHVLFGSDFPHGEGLAEPLEYAERIHDLPADQVEKIMGGNLRGLLGIA